MTATEQMDRIVKEVLRRLAAEHPAAVLPADTLQLREQVITMSTIEGKLSGVRRLLVPARAVVTPAVQDALHAEQIELTRVSVDEVVNAMGQRNSRLVVADLGTTEVASLLRGRGLEIFWVSEKKTLAAAVDELADQLTAADRGLLFTAAPEAAVCLANRNPHVHAFFAHDLRGVRRAMTTMSPNVMVLDAAHGFANRALVQHFLTATCHGA